MEGGPSLCLGIRWIFQTFSSGPEFVLGAYASGGYITAAIVSVRSGELDSELIEEEVTDVLDINNVGVAEVVV